MNHGQSPLNHRLLEGSSGATPGAGMVTALWREPSATHPEAFIQELVRVAASSLDERRTTSQKFEGWVEVRRTATRAGGILAIEDNGLGLKLADTLSMLESAGYGRSSRAPSGVTGTEPHPFARALLNCFLVADEVSILSQHASARTSAFLWRGTHDGKWTAEELDWPLLAGTLIFLDLKSTLRHRLSPKFLEAHLEPLGVSLGWPVRFSAATAMEGCRALQSLPRSY